MAENDHPYAKEAAKVLCKWVEPRRLPTGVHIPHVCFAPDDVSGDDAYQEIMGFWAEWNVVDASASKDAQKSFGEEWNKRWNELRAVSVTAAAQPSDNDSDYSCRAAQNMCRDGMSMCAEYRQDFIRAGRVCPGVTDVAISASAQQSYDAESAPQQAMAICQDVMRQRPLPPVNSGSPSWTAGGWLANIAGQQNQRRAAIALCETDPYAHLNLTP